ncbi:lysosomal cholesterol signaling protein-like [Tachypleus tridentatus]|uniref:lysosomal cholesterol signaling protein-like n=1 Tax=Tachypleus tridentatus TaxID=6853 RepID=UPI003FD0A14C
MPWIASTEASSSANLVPTPGEIAFCDIFPVLLQCFLTVLCGYLAGRCGLISLMESKGLNLFVSYFSLPALIFNSLSSLRLENVNWKFLGAVFVSKGIVFLLVATFTILLTKPVNIGKAGLYGIFCTQSNDFALGFPLASSLYANSHSDYASYLYLLAPIQLMVLNPVGFILMEIQKQRSQNISVVSRKTVFFHVCKGIISNPVVIMTVLGVFGNFVFNHQVPDVLQKFLHVLGSAFSATALFLLGLNMVGKFQLLQGTALLQPAVMIIVKILILPLIIRELVTVFSTNDSSADVKDLANFGFLYGTFPTAPTVFIFAGQFGLSTEVVASGMVACTLFSAPLVFVSAVLSLVSVSSSLNFYSELLDTMTYVSAISLVCCVWVIAIFCMSKKWKNITHGMTLCLVISQLFTAGGGVLRKVINPHKKWMFYLQYFLAAGGTFSARVWTALLSLLLALLQWQGLCFVLKIRYLIIIIGFGISLAISGFLAVGMMNFPFTHNITDPNFHFGETQATVSLVVLASSLIVILTSLTVQQRQQIQTLGYQVLVPNIDDPEAENGTLSQTVTHFSGSSFNEGSQPTASRSDQETSTHPPDIEDLGLSGSVNGLSVVAHLCDTARGCSNAKRKECASRVQRYISEERRNLQEHGLVEITYADTDEIVRHVVLILLLTLSIIVGLALTIWKVVMDDLTGIFIELEFLDIFLNYGQGFISFIIFGLDSKLVVNPCLRVWRRIRFGTEVLVLPAEEELSLSTHQTCDQFLRYHYDQFKRKLYSAASPRQAEESQENYEDCVFTGDELVDWLLAVGLAHDRKEGEHYGRNLLLGRVIQHISHAHHFHDGAYMYYLSEKND